MSCASKRDGLGEKIHLKCLFGQIKVLTLNGGEAGRQTDMHLHINLPHVRLIGGEDLYSWCHKKVDIFFFFKFKNIFLNKFLESKVTPQELKVVVSSLKISNDAYGFPDRALYY